MLRVSILFVLLNAVVTTTNASEKLNYLLQVNAQWQHQPERESLSILAQANERSSYNQWITAHLLLVEQALRNRDVEQLNNQQKQNRNKLLDVLHHYATEGVFPVNDYLLYKNPVFIDRKGTHCAVGYLMLKSGFGALANTINQQQKFAYVHQIVVPGVAEWATEFGFSIDELAWIQPGYPPTTAVTDMDGGVDGTVHTVAVDGQTVYAGGDFVHTASGITCNHVAMWVSGFAGFTWVSLNGGTNGPVYKLLLHNDKLYVAGNFTQAGNINARNVAVYEIAQGQWQALGNGLDSTVRSLLFYNNELYAAGFFTGFVAKWNGNTWQDIGQNFMYGEGARTLEVWDNQLLIGGNFELATGMIRKHVATYNGTNMGFLTNGTATPVNDFEVFDGKLYAACTIVDGTDTCALAVYENQQWQCAISPTNTLGDHLDGEAIYAIRSAGDALLCAGEFNAFTLMTYGNSLMAFKPATVTVPYNVYQPLLFTDAGIRAIDWAGNQLYFGGTFTRNNVNDTLNHIGYLSYSVTNSPSLPGENVRVYPNPAHAMITVEHSSVHDAQQLEVYNLHGQRIRKQAVSSGITQIPLSDLPAGMYVVNLIAAGGSYKSTFYKW